MSAPSRWTAGKWESALRVVSQDQSPVRAVSGGHKITRGEARAISRGPTQGFGSIKSKVFGFEPGDSRGALKSVKQDPRGQDSHFRTIPWGERMVATGGKVGDEENNQEAISAWQEMTLV